MKTVNPKPGEFTPEQERHIASIELSHEYGQGPLQEDLNKEREAVSKMLIDSDGLTPSQKEYAINMEIIKEHLF